MSRPNAPAQAGMLKHPAVPYVLPFAVFMLLLAIQNRIPIPQTVEFSLRIAILAAVMWIFSRGVIDLGMSRPLGTIAMGLGVFVLWVAPDVLFPGYRQHWLFQNSITGTLSSSLDATTRASAPALWLRSIRAALIVPVLEELFWRGWLMRYLIRPDFLKVPLGTFARGAFTITALLFAAEHGPFWDVGLMAGIAYNFWMCRTKRLGDVIWAHAITNAALCAYVVATGKWEYWL